MKIYCESKFHDYLLTTYINDLMNNLKVKNIIHSWFFIRYKDDKDHIRLRIFYEIKSLELYNIINDFQKSLYNTGLVSKIVYEPYEREYLRYGGDDNISFFEKIFYRESQDIIRFLKNKDSITKECFFVCTCIQTMKNLKLNENEMLMILKDFKVMKKNKKSLKLFLIDHMKQVVKIKSLFIQN